MAMLIAGAGRRRVGAHDDGGARADRADRRRPWAGPVFARLRSSAVDRLPPSALRLQPLQVPDVSAVRICVGLARLVEPDSARQVAWHGRVLKADGCLPRAKSKGGPKPSPVAARDTAPSATG